MCLGFVPGSFKPDKVMLAELVPYLAPQLDKLQVLLAPGDPCVCL